MQSSAERVIREINRGIREIINDIRIIRILGYLIGKQTWLVACGLWQTNPGLWLVASKPGLWLVANNKNLARGKHQNLATECL